MRVVFLVIRLALAEHFFAIEKVYLFEIGWHADLRMLSQEGIQRGGPALLGSTDNEINLHRGVKDLHQYAKIRSGLNNWAENEWDRLHLSAIVGKPATRKTRPYNRRKCHQNFPRKNLTDFLVSHG
jgi:hypothetical protein